MTTEAQRRMLLPHTTVIEEDDVLKHIFVGSRVIVQPYQPAADDPLREFGGFTLPRPLYYSPTWDVFFTVR